MAPLLLCFTAAASASLVTADPFAADSVSLLQVGSNTRNRVAHTVTSLESYGPLALSQLQRRQVPEPSPAKLVEGTAAMMSMRSAPENEIVQRAGCEALARAMTTGSWLTGYVNQEYFVSKGAHKVAMSAMKTFLDNAEVQLACSQALNNMVHLNAPMADIVGGDGAMEVLDACMRRHQDSPVTMGVVFGIIGGFCDYSLYNRQRVAELGDIELAFNITQRHKHQRAVLGLQCLASTQCWPEENRRQLKVNGYIPLTLQHMRDFPSVPGIRGEGIFVLGMGFQGEADSDEAMVENGLIEEIVSALRDAPNMQLDVLSTTDRVYAYGIDLLGTFSRERPEWRERAVQAGAAEQVAASMLDFAQSTAKANVAMQKFSLDHLDVLGKGCNTLRALSTGSTEGGKRLGAVHDRLYSVLLAPNASFTVPTKCSQLLG